jgi:OFA family oxalate/formate antiporter-like MFS transporter
MIDLKIKGNNPITAIVGCLCVQLCVGILYLWSVFKTPVVLYFSWNAAAANMVSSYMLFSFVSGNLIGGYFQDRTNPKLVAAIGCFLFCAGVFLSSLLTASNIALIYLTYCVLGGLGSGFAYGSVISCVQKWLPHRCGFASGLSVSAFGLSTVIFSPLSKWLLSLPSFAGREVPLTFRTLSIVFFLISMASCLLIRLPSEEYLKGLGLPANGAAANGTSKTPLQAMREANFWCLFFACFFINATWNICVPLIKDLGMQRGLPETWAVMTVSLTGVTNAAGRLIMASVSDKIGRTATIILLSSITGVCALLLLFAGGPVYTLVILAIAFAYGGPSAVHPAMTTDFFGSKFSGTNYGIVMLALGFSSVAFNGLSNLLVHATGGYAASFLVAAAASIIPIFLMRVIASNMKKSVGPAAAVPSGMLSSSEH